MKPLSVEQFAQFVDTSVDHAKVFLELAGNDPVKARDMYTKVSDKQFVPFEVLSTKSTARQDRKLQTLFTPEQEPQSLPDNYQGTVVSFYTNGFTINHGPLRDFEEPQNRQFIEELQQGMIRGICPKEFLSEQANENNEIKIRIERKNKPWNPFFLRNETTKEDMNLQDLHEYGTWVQKGIPVTKVKVCLPHKTNLLVSCNTSHAVGTMITNLALALRVDPSRLSLVSTHPRRVWTHGDTMTVQDAGMSFSHVFLRISLPKT